MTAWKRGISTGVQQYFVFSRIKSLRAEFRQSKIIRIQETHLKPLVHK